MTGRGRPSKRTPAIEQEIVEILGRGNTRRVAAAIVGIEQMTLVHWIQRYPDFALLVKKAEADAETKMLAIIRRAAQKNWQAAAWYLERKSSDDWGRRERVDFKLQLTTEIQKLAEQLGLSEDDTAAAIREAEALVKRQSLGKSP